MRRNVKQARETMALTRVAIGVGDALSASWRGVPHFWQEMLVLELRNHAPGSLSPASLIVSEQRSKTTYLESCVQVAHSRREIVWGQENGVSKSGRGLM
jgi:hypothetical protein